MHYGYDRSHAWQVDLVLLKARLDQAATGVSMICFVSNKIARCSIKMSIAFSTIGLLLGGTFLQAQSAPIPFVDGQARVTSAPQSGTRFLGVEVLTDTEGIDFGPYIREVLQAISQGSPAATPLKSSNDGPATVLSFSLNREGKMTRLHLDESSGDSGLDRVAWQSIANINGLPALPKDFTGSNFSLRLRFSIPSKGNKTS